ncbi:MAG: O-methyltransferase [Candidatus Flexifilum sp.]|jgi:predicted O-methyltransferase YrrM
MNSTWTAVDTYLNGLLAEEDDALKAALHASAAAGLPEIQVTAGLGKLLQLLARSIGARFILEFGTLGGYSAIWLARALPADGRLITLELEAKHAAVARANLDRAGLPAPVEIRVGPALETVAQLAAENPPPFDFIFIDADKVNTLAYFEWSLRLARPGGLIVVDNIVRDGAIADPAHSDARVQAIRRFLEVLAHERRISATALQTVSAKGYDGLVIARVND